MFSPIRTPVLSIATAAVLFAPPASADDPSWWTTLDEPVLVSQPGSHSSAANVGQAKWMAMQGLRGLAAVMGEADPAVQAIRTELFKETFTDEAGVFYPFKPEQMSPSQLEEWLKDQKGPLQIGALKALARPFYLHLSDLDGAWLVQQFSANGVGPLNSGYFQDTDGTFYPWNPADNGNTDKNHAMANIGQLKSVFSLRFEGLEHIADPDGDGLTTEAELLAGTDPRNADTDGDGMSDDWELAHGFDPLDPDDAYLDPDGDRVMNVREFQLGTNPHDMSLDEDHDGIADDVERSIAKSYLDLDKPSGYWGPRLQDLQDGNLNPDLPYIGTETPREIADVLSNIPDDPGLSSDSRIYLQKQFRGFNAWLYHSPIDPVTGEPTNMYGETDESGEYEAITSVQQVDPGYMETQTENYQEWVADSPVVRSESWDYLGYDVQESVHFSFPTVVFTGPDSTYAEGHKRQTQFRLVRKDDVSQEVTRHMVRHVVRESNATGHEDDPEEFVSAEIVTATIPAGSHFSNWIQLNPLIANGWYYRVWVDPIDLVVDTNRDGLAVPGKNQNADETGEDTWTKDRGAIYTVNFDRDGDNKSGGENRPDAIHFDDNGKAVDEDWDIELPPPGADPADPEDGTDKYDITPMVIKVPGDPPANFKYFLVVDELEDLHAIHLYRRIAGGQQAIWGAYGNFGGGTGGSGDLEIDVTKWLNPNAPGYQDPNDAFSGAVTFGIEGLVLRGMKVPHGTLDEGGPVAEQDKKFSGEIGITLQLRYDKDNQTIIHSADKVKLHVAPWIAQWNSLEAEDVFLADENTPPYSNTDLRNAIGNIVRPVSAYGPGVDQTPTQWLQDHVEVGFTERPGLFGPIRTQLIFRVPYDRGDSDCNGTKDPQPKWPIGKLLGKDVGIFQIGTWLSGVGEDSRRLYGGNLEVLPPNPDLPAGRTICGASEVADIAHDYLRFLQSQSVQRFVPEIGSEHLAPLVGWLRVGHLDEIFGMLGPSRVAVADPTLAMDILNEVPLNMRKGTLLFTKGGRTKVVNMTSASNVNNTFIQTNLNHTGDQALKYLRFISGNLKGTVCRISAYHANGLTVDRMWATGDKVVSPVPGGRNYQEWREYWMGTETNCVYTAPELTAPAMNVPAGSEFVMFEDTLFWTSFGNNVPWDPANSPDEMGMPAAITVSELLTDPLFVSSHSTGYFRDVMLENEARLESYNIRHIDFVRIPVLFLGKQLDGTFNAFKSSRSCEAFNPGGANLQPFSEKGAVIIAKQFGPTTLDKGVSVDLFEKKIKAAFGAQPVKFADDWYLYHTRVGEVHCGTCFRRKDPANFKWWTKQP